MTNLKIRAIFDNGGGLTLQLGDNFGHYYPHNMRQAAEDYKTYLRDGNTDGWEGDEDYSRGFDPEYDQICNGGCKVYNDDEIAELTAGWDATQYEVDGYMYGWANVDMFTQSILALA